MSEKAPQSIDLRSYEFDRTNQPQIPTPWDALEYSRRARFTATSTLLVETVPLNPAVAESREVRLSQAALDKVGTLAVQSMGGFAGGVQDVTQELFGAKPSSNVYWPPVRHSGSNATEYALAA